MCSHDASQGYYNHRIRRVDLATGATTTLAGSGSAGFGFGGFLDGAGGSAQFNGPMGIAIDPSRGFALVAVLASPATPPIMPSRVSPPCTRCRPHPFPSPRHVAHRLGALRSDPSPTHASQDRSNHRIRRVE